MTSKFTPFIALLFAFLLQAIPHEAKASSLPSSELKPILEPCIEAILSPLESYPAMPRFKVEALRADFAASLVTASTPTEKEVYQNAMAVCNAMTSDMDARAKAQAQAEASADMSTLSTGGDIDESMPMHGRNAGGAGAAIGKKQKGDRKDADQRAQRQSGFVNSNAYTSWGNNAPNLREQVMNLYTRQAELEALYKKTAPASATAAGSTASAPGGTGNWSDPSLLVGKWQADKVWFWLSPDKTVTRVGSDNGWKKLIGTWTVDDGGHFEAKFDTLTMKGNFSDDGKTLTTLNKAVFKLKEE